EPAEPTATSPEPAEPTATSPEPEAAAAGPEAPATAGTEKPAAPEPEKPAPAAAAAGGTPAAGGGDGPAKTPAKKAGRGPIFYVAAAGLLVASVVGGKALIGTDRGPVGRTPPPSESPSPSPTAPATKQFRNVDIGITFDYPAEWQDLTSPSVGESTIVIVGTGAGELAKLDVFPLPEPTSPQAVASSEVQASLDKLVASNTRATVTLRQLQTVNGVPAWHYVAQFEDPDLGVGIHDHWFFFSGRKLEKLTFQAFPLREYNEKYRAVFETIVSTYLTVPRGGDAAPGATPVPRSPAPASPAP
ncbi:MAG: hypothetical protein ACRDJO_11925, partial [Actinomycetota bacterium]